MHPISAREGRALRKLLREADQGDGSRTDLASVLQEGGQSANMYIRSGAIGEISAKYPFTHEMKTLLAGLILIHSWYPNECCADKDCHPVPCDEISEAENGAMHWKNLNSKAVRSEHLPIVNVMSAIYWRRVDRLFPFVSSLRRSRQHDIGTKDARRRLGEGRRRRSLGRDLRVTAKNLRSRQPLSLLSSLSFGPGYDSRAAPSELPQPDEKRTVVVVIKRRLPLLLTCYQTIKLLPPIEPR